MKFTTSDHILDIFNSIYDDLQNLEISIFEHFTKNHSLNHINSIKSKLDHILQIEYPKIENPKTEYPKTENKIQKSYKELDEIYGNLDTKIYMSNSQERSELWLD